jgi:glucose/arabinose dehydrogenase
MRRMAVELSPPQVEVVDSPSLVPLFSGADLEREQVAVRLEPVLEGLVEPTDLQFAPGRTDTLLVAEKSGRIRRADLTLGLLDTVLEVDVLTASEQGLLGLAFHPAFPEDRRIFVHMIVQSGDDEVSRISSYRVELGEGRWRAEQGSVILEVSQPFANHNAGQLTFGPDGMLYIGMGDGGWRGDPHGNGQDTTTLLGAMLRIDVSREGAGQPYAIPPDNPFLDQPGARPELWAIGLRNPWRFSFDPLGRMVVADVGQDAWEEVSLVGRGDNLGWRVREGRHCYAPARDCPTLGMSDPVYEYPHSEGQSVTGGYVYTGSELAGLEGHYIFGDFVTGRIWALDLPRTAESEMSVAVALGQWPMAISTFGRDSTGEIYVVDYAQGSVYRLEDSEK